MKKKNKRKPQKTNRKPTKWNLLGLLELLAVVLLYFQRNTIISMCGQQGSAYFFTCMHFLLAILLLLPGVVAMVMEEMVEEMINREQYRNSIWMMYSGFWVTGFFLVVVGIVLFTGFSSYQSAFLYGQGQFMTLVLLFLALSLDAISSIVLGFLNGIRKRKHQKVVVFLRRLLHFIFLLIFSLAYRGQGIKVAGVLHNQEYIGLYTASGAALGIFIGSLAAFLYTFYLYHCYRPKLNRMIRGDKSRKVLDTHDFFRLLLRRACPMGLALLLFCLPAFTDQWIFISVLEGKEKLLSSYQWGAYAGVFYSAILFPVLLLVMRMFESKKMMDKALKQESAQAIRKCNSTLKAEGLLFAFMGMLLAMILAEPFTETILGHQSLFACRIIYAGAPLLLLFYYAFTNYMLLLYGGYYGYLLVDGGVSLFVHWLFSFLLMKNTGLGVYSFIIAGYISLLLLCVLTYFHLYYAYKCRDKFRRLLQPAIVCLITGVAALLLRLVFCLFMPAILTLVLTIALSVLLLMFFIIHFKVIDVYEFAEGNLGNHIYQICHFLRMI